MIQEIRLREEAEEDLSEAAIWYQQQQKGLGYEFLDEVFEVSQSIKNHPFAYPIVHREVRRALIYRFPFGIFYRIEGEAIVIFAIMHASRNPNNPLELVDIIITEDAKQMKSVVKTFNGTRIKVVAIEDLIKMKKNQAGNRILKILRRWRY